MRRVVAKKDADCGRKEKATSGGNQRHPRGPVKDYRNHPGQSNPHRDPRNAAAQTEENSFQEERRKNESHVGRGLVAHLRGALEDAQFPFQLILGKDRAERLPLCTSATSSTL